LLLVGLYLLNADKAMKRIPSRPKEEDSESSREVDRLQLGGEVWGIV
jgi:hypothetical protein